MEALMRVHEGFLRLSAAFINPANWNGRRTRGAESVERSGRRWGHAERVESFLSPCLGVAASVFDRSTRLGANVAVLLKVASLQHLDVMLVNLEGGPESDRQTRQHIAALHQQQGLPVDFLRMNRGKGRVQDCNRAYLKSVQ